MDGPQPRGADPAGWSLESLSASALRALCLPLMAQALAAAERLGDPADTEALHDLRVALRRLRSLIRAYQSLLPRAAGGKLRRTLRDAAAATGEARDLEVQAAWLEGLRGALAAPHHAAIDLLLEGIAARRAAARRRVDEEAVARLPAIRRRLERRLAEDEAAAVGEAWTPMRERVEARFGGAAASRLPEAAALLLEKSREVRGPLDEGPAHEARIAAKQLRYLVEPLRDLPDGAVAGAAAALVKRLRQLQDVLGELHDAHILAHVVERALFAAVAASGPDEALRELHRAVRGVRDEQFDRFGALQRAQLFDHIADDARALAALLVPAPIAPAPPSRRA